MSDQYEQGYDAAWYSQQDIIDGLCEMNDELRAELTEMFEELLRAYLDWEDVAELRYSEGL